MAAKKGGIGSMLGCLVVLAGLGFLGYWFGPRLLALLRGEASAIAWGMEYEENGLRVKVISATIETTDVEDALGARGGEEDLHLRLEITNMSDATLTYRTPRLLRSSEPKLLDDQGREVRPASYGDEARIDGQLEDGREIQARRRERHDLIFKRPSADAKSFLLNVDLAMFGHSGVVQFRIPAEEIRGLK